MHKYFVSMGVLFLLVFSMMSSAQEVKETGIAPPEVASDSAATVPGVPDEINIKSSVGNVLLPHDVHVKDNKLKCVVCHHQIRAEELDTPHPEYLTSSLDDCQTCHSSDSESRKKYYKCSHCHHSEPDNIADETLSSKVVIHKSCWKCHEAGTGAEASKGCSNCHMKEEK